VSEHASSEKESRHGDASLRLFAAGERELQRIVLDMHDGPVQDIFAAVSHLQLLQRELSGQPALSRRADQSAQLLERALGEIRTLIGVFRPPGFERRSLGEILEGLTVQHEAMTDQVVELTMSDDLGDCTLPAKIALYRILQEALANGFRHAGATKQMVSVERVAEGVQLTVTDDGRGFDPSTVLAAEANVGVEGGHFGLRGIQDRIGMLGGTFTLESVVGKGTVLSVTIPGCE
jgi:signal transduction histidine kinase